MKKMKKALSLLLALAMVLGMVNLTAFAEETTTWSVADGAYVANQTNKTLDGEFTGNASNTQETPGKKVAVTKFATATETENEFEVTLQVVTKDVDINAVTSPDAAVVLVIDRSISMDFCSQCKYNGNEQHNGNDIVHTHTFKDTDGDGKCDEKAI